MGVLVWVRVYSMYRVALLFILLFIARETMNAQPFNTASGEGQNASSSADMLGTASAKAPNPADPAEQFSKVLQMVEKRGLRTHLFEYIWNDLGRSNPSMLPLWASALAVVDVDGGRVIYLVDDTNVAVLITERGEQPMVYLVSRAGVLEKAAQMKSGRWGSKSLQNVPLGSAVASFNEERDFWIEQLATRSPAEFHSR
jgi:hypothetical protein